MQGELSDLPTKLRELIELAGEDTARRMTEMLVIEIQNVVPKILKLIEQSDFTSASIHAHSLAGVTASVGCLQLAQVARSLEFDLQAGHVDPARLSQLCSAAADAEAILHAFVIEANLE